VSVYRVLDKLEAYVRSGTVLPLKNRILSEERLYEFVEKIRATLPEEVGRAKLIAKDKDRVLREAQEKAAAIVSDASETHAHLVDEHEIVRRARVTAETVLREAEARAQKIREGADAYAASVLGDLDGRLAGALASVRKGRAALGSASEPTPITSVQPLAEAAARSKREAVEAAAQATMGETAELETV
jgi:hypothetical protein